MKTNPISTKQAQKNGMSTSNSEIPQKSAAKVGLPSKHIIWFITILSLGIVLPSLIALILPSCDEGSLQVKVWGFEYQLTKKGSCSSQPEITRK